MEQPTSRKSVAQVAAKAAAEPDAPPSSPETVLDLDESSMNGLRTYKGKFKYRVPTMGDRVDIVALKAQYLQQLTGVDNDGDNIAEALAYLNVTLSTEKNGCPQWWVDSKGGINLYDFQPLLALYAKARAYEATFLGRAPVVKLDEGADGEGPDADGDGAMGRGVQDPPVGRKVLASFGAGGSGAGDADPGGGAAEGRGDGDGDAGGSA
jgi:hypothetical protein